MKSLMTKKKIKKTIKRKIKRKVKKMNITQDTVTINGLEYVLKSAAQNTKAESLNGLEYKIIRCDRSGVFAGYLKSLNGQEAIIIQARRLWYWSGAASLSQMAIDGTTKPNDCKFPEAVSKILVTDAIEILDVTKKAKDSIEAVKVWRQ